MSLHEAIEIQQREADLKKASLPTLAATGLFVALALVFIGFTAMFTGGPRASRDAPELIMIAAVGIYLTWLHFKNRRRIAVLELEVLKLKRRLSESQE